jgi:anti-sigma B factor antagonist
MVEINVETLQETGTADSLQISVVRVIGEIDAISASQVQQKVLPLSLPGCNIIMDMSNVAYMSSAGLRMLLSAYRQVSSNQGRIILVGLSEELQDTMSMTGFLGYFSVYASLETGVQSFV